MKLAYYLESRHEWGEFSRTIEDLDLSITPKEMVELFENTPETILTDEVWGDLDNCDNTVQTEDEVRERLMVYDRDPDVYDKILEELKGGRWYPPLILKMDDYYYLVAGNTRLMVAKVNHIHPKVKIAEI
jgi:hypothetical protein